MVVRFDCDWVEKSFCYLGENEKCRSRRMSDNFLSGWITATPIRKMSSFVCFTTGWCLNEERVLPGWFHAISFVVGSPHAHHVMTTRCSCVGLNVEKQHQIQPCRWCVHRTEEFLRSLTVVTGDKWRMTGEKAVLVSRPKVTIPNPTPRHQLKPLTTHQWTRTQNNNNTTAQQHKNKIYHTFGATHHLPIFFFVRQQQHHPIRFCVGTRIHIYTPITTVVRYRSIYFV